MNKMEKNNEELVNNKSVENGNNEKRKIMYKSMSKEKIKRLKDKYELREDTPDEVVKKIHKFSFSVPLEVLGTAATDAIIGATAVFTCGHSLYAIPLSVAEKAEIAREIAKKQKLLKMYHDSDKYGEIEENKNFSIESPMNNLLLEER